MQSLYGTLRTYLESEEGRKAAGIALTQLGILKSGFAYWRENFSGEREMAIVFNPMVEAEYGDVISEIEGCLSIPDKKFVVNRWEQLTVVSARCNYVEPPENERYIVQGEEARIWQHEFDHTVGVLVSDKGTLVPKNIGRNDPCPCMSGKKFKKCCGRNE